MDEADAYDLDVLVEVHDEPELGRAIAAGATLLGINNRNLRTLETDLAVSEHLLPKVPPGTFAISESGMRDAGDVARLRAAGARGFLIGEALMQCDERGTLVAALRGAATRAPAVKVATYKRKKSVVPITVPKTATAGGACGRPYEAAARPPNPTPTTPVPG